MTNENIINSRILKPILNPERVIVLWGGSASGKTTNTLIYMLSQLFGDRNKSWNGAIVRRYYPELKKGLWKSAKKMISDWGFTKRVKINQTDLTISRGERTLFFINAENEERFKGLEFNLIFIDECNQVSEETFLEILNRSGRQKGSETKIIVAFNPISLYNWAYQRLVLHPIPNSKAFKLTYKDNIDFLSQTYIDELEGYKFTCPRRYEVYTLGNAGVFEGLIYSPDKWDMPDKTPYINYYDCFGLDFGFNHPTVLVGCKRMEDGSFYVHETYYASETTIADVIKWLQKTEPAYHFKSKFIPIYCDHSEADRIEELKRAGYNAQKAIKDVDAGISFCQGLIIHLTPYSQNLRKEIEMYSWAKDKDNNFIEKPVKINDDGCDAMRYGLFTHFGKRKGLRNNIQFITTPSYNHKEEEYEW